MDNRRLILLFVFSFSLVMLWDSWQKYNQPHIPVQPTTPRSTASGSSVPSPSATNSTSTTATSVPVVDALPTMAKGKIVNIKTDLFVADVSTQGGDIVGLELNNYKSIDDKDKPFSLFEAKHQYVAQSGLIGEGLPN